MPNDNYIHDKYVKEQLIYYRERASEYDEWFLRQGRYDQGEEHTTAWFSEVSELQDVLAAMQPLGNVLELACGTGWWTEQLTKYADSVTAVDASDEVMKLNAERTSSSKVTYLRADIFNLNLKEKYDFIFFSFWLSHVPPERFDAFWQQLSSLLKPNGRVFFIDSVHKKEATSKDQVLPPQDATVAKRKLKDGREFEIVKIFYQAQKLTEQLEQLNWKAKISQTEKFFLYGEVKK